MDGLGKKWQHAFHGCCYRVNENDTVLSINLSNSRGCCENMLTQNDKRDEGKLLVQHAYLYCEYHCAK